MKKLYIIGMGPGDLNYLAPAARKALEQSSDVVAYQLYLDLLDEIIEGKQHHALELGKEIERAELALDLAAEKESVALVSSGDAGIFAMATLVFELLDKQPKDAWNSIDVEVIAGISALQLAASRVGAPLAHDFCAISLSDLLTPWETIDTRIKAAAQGDFVIAFYNPVSKKRDWQLDHAKQVLLKHRPADCPVIIARNLSREDENITVTTLSELDSTQVDMLTLVMVGNSETRAFDKGVYTPRGYSKKLKLEANS